VVLSGDRFIAIRKRCRRPALAMKTKAPPLAKLAQQRARRRASSTGVARRWKAPRVRRIVSLFAKGRVKRPSWRRRRSQGRRRHLGEHAGATSRRRERPSEQESPACSRSGVCDRRCPGFDRVGVKLPSRAIARGGAGVRIRPRRPLTRDSSAGCALKGARPPVDIAVLGGNPGPGERGSIDRAVVLGNRFRLQKSTRGAWSFSDPGRRARVIVEDLASLRGSNLG
jgi:hypothetical protein